MKKQTAAIALFLTAFIAAYLAICFAAPGMRIKLEAEPMEYFIESIQHMMFMKSLISLFPALIFGSLPLFLGRKK